MITLGRMRYLLFFLLLISCAGGNYREERIALREISKAGNFEEAKNLVTDKEFINEDESLLLKLIEEGTVFYLAGDYYDASKYFADARKLSDDLFTKRVGNKIASAVDDNNDIYYGLTYELSLLRFYSSLAYYNLYREGKYFTMNEKGEKTEKKLTKAERHSYLMAARSMILEWDSFMNGRVIAENDKTYMDDMLLKFWGAFIHEEVGTRSDLQIAQKLYEGTKQTLNYRFMVMPSYNKRSDIFVRNIDHIGKLDRKEVDKMIEKTELSKNLENFIDNQIERLKKGEKENFTILLKEDFVTLKEAERFSSNIVSHDTTALKAFTMFGISNVTFELPVIKQKPMDDAFVAKITDLKTKNVQELPIVLVEPISDIAFRSIEEKLPDIIETEQSRLSAKYTAAAATAMASYMATSMLFDNDILAIMAGLAVFNSLEEQIAENSKIDLRQWTTLADNVRMVREKLPNGKYKLEIVRTDLQTRVKKVVYKKDFQISNDSVFIDIQI